MGKKKSIEKKIKKILKKNVENFVNKYGDLIMDDKNNIGEFEMKIIEAFRNILSISSLGKTLKQIEGNLESFGLQIDNIEKSLSDQQKTVSSFSSDLKEYKKVSEVNKDLNCKIVENQSSLEQKESQISHLISQIEQKEKDIKSKDEQIQKLKMDFQNYTQANERQISDKDRIIENITLERDKISRQKDDLVKNLDLTQKQIKKEKDEIMGLESMQFAQGFYDHIKKCSDSLKDVIESIFKLELSNINEKTDYLNIIRMANSIGSSKEDFIQSFITEVRNLKTKNKEPMSQQEIDLYEWLNKNSAGKLEIGRKGDAFNPKFFRDIDKKDEKSFKNIEESYCPSYGETFAGLVKGGR